MISLIPGRRSRLERRRVEEWNASTRKERQEEKLKLKLRMVAGEVIGYVRRIKCTECRWHTKWGIVLVAGEVIGRVWRTQCAECRLHTCMEVLRVMQYTREDEAHVAAVQGTVVEDGRDALVRVRSSLATRMHGCYKLERL